MEGWKPFLSIRFDRTTTTSSRLTTFYDGFWHLRSDWWIRIVRSFERENRDILRKGFVEPGKLHSFSFDISYTELQLRKMVWLIMVLILHSNHFNFVFKLFYYFFIYSTRGKGNFFAGRLKTSGKQHAEQKLKIIPPIEQDIFIMRAQGRPRR